MGFDSLRWYQCPAGQIGKVISLKRRSSPCSNQGQGTKQLAIVQWIVHRASTSRMWVRFLLAGPNKSAIGEMDIISVFETEGVGSIPAWPAR